MRLVHIHTLTLEHFGEAQVPPYAILSHRWTEEELTFKEVLKGRTDVRKRGYIKLLGACRIATNYDVSYVWIDTCCIDKTSSAELQESINSMFKWYQKARVCLVYLEDVDTGVELEQSFRNSIWFTRSWTLQELLAPKRVEFYERQWAYIGGKNANMSNLRVITGISREILDGSRSVRECSTATRMSWAAKRSATRSEDVAYSLMGIFDINMPLLYGEGQKAFIRLQEEILRRTSDTTILCWGLDLPTTAAISIFGDPTHSLLASSPADFRAAPGLDFDFSRFRCQIGITNVGLEIEAEVVRWDLNTFGIWLGEDLTAQRTYLALVRKHPHEKTLQRLEIVQMDSFRYRTSWRRNRRLLILWAKEDIETDLDILHAFDIKTEESLPVIPKHLIRGFGARPAGSEVGNISGRNPQITWDFGDPMLPSVATLACQISETLSFWIDLSFDFDGRPCCLIYNSARSDWRTVWRVSSTVPETEPSGELEEEHLMTVVQDISTGAAAWFLRSQSAHKVTYARLPSMITGEDREIWVYFALPGYGLYHYEAVSVTWKFRICYNRPFV